MKIQKYNIRGAEMNKMQFSEIEDYLEEKGLNVNEIFEMIADEKNLSMLVTGLLAGLGRTKMKLVNGTTFLKKRKMEILLLAK